MSIRKLFPIKLLTAVIVFSLVLSSTGIKPAQAQTSAQPVQLQVETLEATLDKSMKLETFGASDNFIVHFNAAMNIQSSPNPLLAYPYVNGSSNWNAEQDTLTFSPEKPLQAGERYTFFIDPALSSSAGTVFESSPQWTVQVSDGTQVLSISPRPGLLSTRQPLIAVTFDQPMERTSTEQALSIQPNIHYQLTWKSDREIQIQLNEVLLYGQQYTFMFAGGSAENVALDKKGSPLAEDYSWSYGLGTFSAEMPPPTLPNTVQIKFSHALRVTETGFPFTITPPLAGKWKWQGNKTAVFAADEPLPIGQVFSLEITDSLFDSDGEISFDRSAFQFIAPPPIAAVEPRNEDGGIPVGFSPIKIVFKTGVNQKSVERAFRITPAVSGRFEWNKSTESPIEDVLLFYPNQILQYATQYTVALDPSLTDAKGNPLLLEPYSWTFNTSYGYYDLVEAASFGYGSKIQVLDVLGSRRVQFSASEKEIITFEAYAYDLIDFASLYADYVHGNGIPIPNKAEHEPVATWNYVEVNPIYQETIIPPDVPPGLYVLNLKYGGRSFDQLLVALTRNTIVAKQTGEDLFVWVSNINGGDVPEAEVRVYSDRGEKIREGKTDENGVYRVTIPDGYSTLLVSARTGEKNEDVAIAGLDSRWREYAYGFWSRESDAHKYLTYIYTDRPIYRPGQTVNFKAIVRRDKDLKYAVPDNNLPITVNIRDAKNNLLQTSTFNANEFGTINGTFAIAAEAPLGDYKIETVVNGETSSQIFKVQDYRKPDFSVSVAPSQADQVNKFVNNDRVDLTVKADYFFGEPVTNAKLTYEIYRLLPQYTWGSWDAAFAQVNYSWMGRAYNPGVSVTTTDAKGQAQIAFAARFDNNDYFTDYDYWGSSLRYRTYALEVTADDGSNQPVSSSYIFNVYNSIQKVTLDTDGYFKQADQPFTITIHTRTIADQALAGRALQLQIRSWNSKNYDFDDKVEGYNIQTDKDGLAKQELSLPTGYYKLILSGKDERGNQLNYERWLRVLSSAQQWTVRYWDPISISAEQDEYKPYQTARFAIESTVSGPGLLTFERGSVIHSKFITLTAPLTVVEAEIIPEDAPNVFVSVHAWAPVTPPSGEEIQYYRRSVPDSQLMMATTELKVTAEAKKLDMNISTDKQTYSPGEEVTVNMDVKDSSGNPALAEVSLAMVDEAIFSLSSELAPNIFTAFYGPRPWSVSTFSSMRPSRVLLDEGGRGGGGGESFSGPAPRSDFRDTAAWFPALRTDSNGRATVTFTLPDNLTSWRLSAKAISLNHLVGQSHINIETKQDLLLRPLLPRILTVGDQTQITTMIHNYSSTDQKLRVTLNAPGFKFSSEATQAVTVKANEVLAVGWSVVPEVAAETNATFVAVADSGLNDSIQLPLPVQPLAIKDIQSMSGNFNGAITLPLPLPPDILPEASVVTLKLSRTPASTILDGLEYLTGYPYGCVEQTMSRAMPNAVLGRASAQLGIGGEEFRTRTKPLIEASLQKLYGLQHRDGGWGWWYDDDSDAYQTAWVLHGLSNIRDAGYFIDPQVLERGSSYLNYQLDKMDIRTRAYALYSMALSEHGNLNEATALMNSSLTELDPFSQAALALAFAQLEDQTDAEKILNQLQKSVVQKGDLAYWPQSTVDGEYGRKTMSSTIRTTAMALSAFIEIQGPGPLTDSIASFLMQNRTGHGWGTTNETSFTILALTDYLAEKQEYSGTSDFTVEINGNSAAAGTFQTGNLFTSIGIPIEQLKSGLNDVRLSTSGTDPLYYDLITSYTAQTTTTAAAGKVTLTRRYLDPKTNKPLETITEGQLVKIELTVKLPSVTSFVIVEDRLPGGLEALNESLNSTTQDTLYYDYDYYEERFFWQDYGYNYKEIRGDRVSFFVTEISQGPKTFKYLARATMSGSFTALPAEAYAMYDEQMWGRSSSLTMIILPK
jgi:uncharacterized protein YfaS (alpha-2-macroglobulin family)